MDGHTDLTGIAVVGLAALLCGMAMTRLRQPAIVGYILAGILLGPTAAGLVDNVEQIRLLANLGVLMLLFMVGLELPVAEFMKVWRMALLIMGGQITDGVKAAIKEAALGRWSENQFADWLRAQPEYGTSVEWNKKVQSFNFQMAAATGSAVKRIEPLRPTPVNSFEVPDSERVEGSPDLASDTITPEASGG